MSADVTSIEPLPQPRKDHIDDGPCANIWEWPGRGLVGCQDRCRRMRRMNRS